MNTFDSQHSLNYGDDILESNPFADTPSRSTELRISTSFSSDSEVESEEIVEQQTEPEVEQEELLAVDKHEGDKALSPVSSINQLEELTLDSPPSPQQEQQQQEEVETDTQVKREKKVFKKFPRDLIMCVNTCSQNLYKSLKVDQDLISK